MVLENLKPKEVWDIFENIFTKTFRASKHEDLIRERIINWISEKNRIFNLNIQIFTDEAGNILLKKPSNIFELNNAPPLLLQGHLDMVNETDLIDGFDFKQTPLPIKIEDNQNWVTSEGTTLGADNAIGVSIILAIISDSSFQHGPLEVLLTVDEETGLTGAFKLNLEKLDIKSKYLINVDSEDLGIITIGSAGGGGVILSNIFSYMDPQDYERCGGCYCAFEFKIEGLLGGHSGVDIHLGRPNAHKIASNLLQRTISDVKSEEAVEFYISDWNGGSKHNAIPRSCQCTFVIPVDIKETFLDNFNSQKKFLTNQLTETPDKAKALEPNIKISIKEIPMDSLVVNSVPKLISENDSLDLLSVISLIPHGVISYSETVPGLVETSNNLAIITTNHENMQFIVELSARSNIDSELERFRNSLLNLCEMGGWTAILIPSYPGWKPKPDNPFLRYIKEKYEFVLGREVKIDAIHAGLEAGIIGAKIPGMDMVSIGPTIKNPHTPQERVEISSVEKFNNIMREIISKFQHLKSEKIKK